MYLILMLAGGVIIVFLAAFLVGACLAASRADAHVQQHLQTLSKPGNIPAEEIGSAYDSASPGQRVGELQPDSQVQGDQNEAHPSDVTHVS